MATKTIGKAFNGSLKPGETLEKMIMTYEDEPFTRNYVRALLAIEKETGFEVIELRDALFNSLKHGTQISMMEYDWTKVQKVLNAGVDPNRIKSNNSFFSRMRYYSWIETPRPGGQRQRRFIEAGFILRCGPVVQYIVFQQEKRRLLQTAVW